MGFLVLPTNGPSQASALVTRSEICSQWYTCEPVITWDVPCCTIKRTGRANFSRKEAFFLCFQNHAGEIIQWFSIIHIPTIRTPNCHIPKLFRNHGVCNIQPNIFFQGLDFGQAKVGKNAFNYRQDLAEQGEIGDWWVGKIEQDRFNTCEKLFNGCGIALALLKRLSSVELCHDRFESQEYVVRSSAGVKWA